VLGNFSSPIPARSDIEAPMRRISTIVDPAKRTNGLNDGGPVSIVHHVIKRSLTDPLISFLSQASPTHVWVFPFGVEV
jgi:hypothetical protein